MGKLKRKGILSGGLFSILNLLIFGFLPIPIMAYYFVSLLGEFFGDLLNIAANTASIVAGLFLLLTLSTICLIMIRKSKKSFDWLILLLLIQFVLLNGMAFKFIEFRGLDPNTVQLTFLLKTTPFYLWIYPVTGWCYDKWWSPSEQE